MYVRLPQGYLINKRASNGFHFFFLARQKSFFLRDRLTRLDFPEVAWLNMPLSGHARLVFLYIIFYNYHSNCNPPAHSKGLPIHIYTGWRLVLIYKPLPDFLSPVLKSRRSRYRCTWSTGSVPTITRLWRLSH